MAMTTSHDDSAIRRQTISSVTLVTTLGLDLRFADGERHTCRVHIERAGKVVNTGESFETLGEAEAFRSGAYLALRAVGVSVDFELVDR